MDARTIAIALLLGIAACSSADKPLDARPGAESRIPDRGRGDLCQQGAGECAAGDTAPCMNAEGKPALKRCDCGRWSSCVYECATGSSRTCSGGKQLCVDNLWGPCQP
jgi:hypothetical protein